MGSEVIPPAAHIIYLLYSSSNAKRFLNISHSFLTFISLGVSRLFLSQPCDYIMRTRRWKRSAMSWKRWMFSFELWSKLWSKRLHRLQTCNFRDGNLQKQGYKTKNPASKCRICGSGGSNWYNLTELPISFPPGVKRGKIEGKGVNSAKNIKHQDKKHLKAIAPSDILQFTQETAENQAGL